MNQPMLFIGGDAPPGGAAATEATLRQALASDEDRLGPDHAEVGVHLNNLAALLLGAGRAQEALPLIVRARDIMLGAFDGDHPHKHATYETLVAVVRQVDAEGAAPPNLRPFAAQIRAADEAARKAKGGAESTPQAPAPAAPPPALAAIEVAPIAPPAPNLPVREPAPVETPRASPLGALGNLIFGARPHRRK
ncbi:MAG: hypothetical protein K2P70_03050 [Hyphomonadaceae bacterium]|nr:hypothetical protein [Hyphomonadaceae bacterium]